MKKLLSLQQFKDLGYLQEVNRRFFHPLGLALAVMVNQETGKVERLGPIRDARSDFQGVVFANDGKSMIDVGKAMDIDREWEIRAATREKALGFMVQPALGVKIDD